MFIRNVVLYTKEEWVGIVGQHMPHLSRSQAVVLALWSFGMVMSKSCGSATVSSFIAIVFGQKENTVRQRLRERYWDDEDKMGIQQVELAVSGCIVPYARWLYQEIVRVGWHPFLRLKTSGTVRPQGQADAFWYGMPPWIECSFKHTNINRNEG